MITAGRQRERTAPLGVKKSIARLLKALMRALESLDGDLDDAIKASPAWRTNEDLLASVPGIGRVIARTVIADLPELGRLDRRQIAALAGLAPWTRQSGQWRGKSFIGAGRADVRSALYMGALVAARHNPGLKAFRDKLIAAGKPKSSPSSRWRENASPSSTLSSETKPHGALKTLDRKDSRSPGPAGHPLRGD
jgi:transposase